MQGWLLIGLAAVIGLQFPVALLVWLDGKRLNLRKPGKYPIAIMYLLLFGWVLVPRYLRERDELPRVGETDDQTTTALDPDEHQDDQVCWEIDLRGWHNLPRRVAYGLGTAGRYIWVGWFVLAPGALFLLSVRFSDGLEPYVIFVLVSVLFFDQLQTRTMSVGAIDTTSNQLTLTRSGGWTSAANSTEESDLTDLGAVEFRRVGEYVVVFCRYDESRLPRLKRFLVPVDRIESVREAVAECGVDVPDSAVADLQTDWGGQATVWGRTAVSLLTLCVGPVVAFLL